MGSGSSKQGTKHLEKEVLNIWKEVQRSCRSDRLQNRERNINRSKRSGWKSIRIFVSSTFKDFNKEREILIKEVFPDLRNWCQKRRLHLIECDLRWGIPNVGNEKDEILKTCLREIDRCYDDNQWPFFINMTCERVGWVPSKEEVPDDIKHDYQWIFGLSVTEMEIIHAAYRIDNPNALFLLRDSTFLNQLPVNYKNDFSESNQFKEIKLKILKSRIHERFPSNRVQSYTIQFHVDEETHCPVFDGYDRFREIVFKFFKERIEEQYPIEQQSECRFECARNAQEGFMISRAECVEGRDDILQSIKNYITEETHKGLPLLIVGEAGMGKTALLAKGAQLAVDFCRQNKNLIPEEYRPSTGAAAKHSERMQHWYVFYHFVGSSAGSTNLEFMLRRFLKEVYLDILKQEVSKEANVFNTVCATLSSPTVPPIVIFIDAVNQFQKAGTEPNAEAAFSLSWLPSQLAPQVRCILSMITNSEPHRALKKRFTRLPELTVNPLDINTKRTIVTKTLANYSKVLDANQMSLLLAKQSSDNPLWLSIACEELRVHGDFRTLSSKIQRFSDGLLELEMQVIQRIQSEGHSELFKAFFCLLEVSVHGMLENEMRQILGLDLNQLIPPNSEMQLAELDFQQCFYFETDPLPAYKWAGIYRSVKTFLRPFGDSDEGRLDFYHRSLSKSVRQLFLKDKPGVPQSAYSVLLYKWWHKLLADFFICDSSVTFERKLEEIPTHLLACGAKEDLVFFLADWRVLEHLYDDWYSAKLLNLWRSCSTLQEMFETYSSKLNESSCALKPDPGKLLKMADQYYKLVMLSLQCNQYKTGAELFEMLLDLEAHLGNRPERLCDVYWLQCSVCQGNQLELGNSERRESPLAESIEACNKSINARIPFAATSIMHKTKLAVALNRLAISYTDYLQLHEQFGCCKQRLLKEARANAEPSAIEAMKIFQELGDMGNVGYVKYTLSRIRDQIQLCFEAENQIVENYGELHIYLHSVYPVLIMYYKKEQQWSKAYDYLLKERNLCSNLFGLESPHSRLCNKTFSEPWALKEAQLRSGGSSAVKKPQKAAKNKKSKV